MTKSENPVGNQDSLEILDLSRDDDLFLRWARDIGFNLKVQQPNVDAEDENEYVPSVRGQIYDWFDEFYVPVLTELWDKYVPKQGASRVLQGEMARCIFRLEGEYFKNGMINMGDGYYDSMVDKIRDTVLEDRKFSPLVQSVMEKDAMIVKGANYEKIINSSFFQETDVEESLYRMKMVVAAWCISKPEPIEYVPSSLD